MGGSTRQQSEAFAIVNGNGRSLVEQTAITSATSLKASVVDDTKSSLVTPRHAVVETGLPTMDEVAKKAEWYTLPANRNSEQDRKQVENLSDAELMIGRVAMVGAISLLVGEVMTGQSIFEQVMDVVSRSS